MAQIIISLLIFILAGLSGVNAVQAGKYYYFPKNELSAQLQSVRPGGQNIDVAEWLKQQGIDSVEYAKLIDAISRGISEEDLKALLSEMGASETGIQKILSYLDSLGAATTTPPTASSEGQKREPRGVWHNILNASGLRIKSPEGGGGEEGGSTPIPAPARGIPAGAEFRKTPEGGGGGKGQDVLPTSGATGQTERRTPAKQLRPLSTHSRIMKLPEINQQVTELREAQVQALQSIKTAEPEARKAILAELQAKRQALVENIQTSRQEIRKQAQTIRAQFREKMEAATGDSVIYQPPSQQPATKMEAAKLRLGNSPRPTALVSRLGREGRVAIAHAYGVRVANRFQVAIARLENILNRLESRKAKLEAQGYDVSEIAPPIEEAKNTLTESRAKLVELEALYEEMLVSDNPSELAKEAAAKVKELKNQLSEVMEKVITPSGHTIVRNIRKPA